MSQRPVLVIMLKEPRIGSVKTRLAADIGPVAATFAFRHMASHIVARLASSRRWQTVLAIAPDTAINSPMLAYEGDRQRQGGGDLGHRLQRLLQRWPTANVVVIGSDSPDIRAGDIAEAFHQLGRHRLVLGPSDDGGFWLIGRARLLSTETLFDTVRWSTSTTRADVEQNLREAPALLRPLHDCDDGAAHYHMRNRLGRRVMPRTGGANAPL